jgi:Domain of unknown function (DUF4862)
MSIHLNSSPWLLGAYSLSASLTHFARADAEYFYAQLQTLPSIRGLELPVHVDSKIDDPWLHVDLLPRHWDYVLTDIPGIMQSLGRNPDFGLASPNESGRQAALNLMETVRQRVHTLNQHCGRQAVRGIHWHSAPSVTAKSEVLRSSLAELTKWDWDGAELWLEHCDAYVPGQSYAKGFLPLAAELPILQEFACGLTFNWGRSVLETRTAASMTRDIQAAQSAGVLRAFIFSGLTVNDPIYGSWQDNHAPLAIDGDSPSWAPTGSLLTSVTLLDALQQLQPFSGSSAPLLGIKVQPAPTSLTLAQRVDFIRAQIAGFDKGLARVRPA